MKKKINTGISDNKIERGRERERRKREKGLMFKVKEKGLH